MNDKPDIILITETVAQSWARDASTWAFCLATILPGWWIGSVGLSAVGFIAFWLAIIGRIANAHNEYKMTIAQARAKLDELEGRKMTPPPPQSRHD